MEELDPAEVRDIDDDSIEIDDLGRQNSSIKLSESIRSSAIAVSEVGRRSTKVIRISDVDETV